MNSHFPRIITLLRKERGLSLKKRRGTAGCFPGVAFPLRKKGIRECGLEFVVKVGALYNVSTDYLLGRSPHRSGAMITVEDLPETVCLAGKENVFRGSLLPTLNKKLIVNSLNVIYGILQKCNNKHLTTEISSFLSVAVYKAFRLLYSANGKNPQGLFSVPQRLSDGRSNAAQDVAISNAEALACGEDVDEMEGRPKNQAPLLSPEQLSEEYPLFASSLFNLIQNAEGRIGRRKKPAEKTHALHSIVRK